LFSQIRLLAAALKIAIFCGLLRVVGRISTLSLEIRIVSRKFKRVAGNPPKSGTFLLVREVSVLQLNFSICSERSESSAAVLIFLPTTSFSTGVLDFRPSIAIFQRDFFFFNRTA